MSLKLAYQKASNAHEAFKIIQTNITAETIAKYKVKAELDYDEEAKKIVATGKGFSLTMLFQDDHASLDLDVSFLLKPLKGQILGSLEKQMARIL